MRTFNWVGQKQVVYFLHVTLFSLLLVSLAEGWGCNPSPCKHGRCVTREPNYGYHWNYSCECDAGYIGAHCQWDAAECREDTTTPCLNGGRCVMRNDGRFCECPGKTNYTVIYGGHYCELEYPCVDCPEITHICQEAPTWPRGRVCLDQRFRIIKERIATY